MSGKLRKINADRETRLIDPAARIRPRLQILGMAGPARADYLLLVKDGRLRLGSTP